MVEILYFLLSALSSMKTYYCYLCKKTAMLYSYCRLWASQTSKKKLQLLILGKKEGTEHLRNYEEIKALIKLYRIYDL